MSLPFSAAAQADFAPPGSAWYYACRHLPLARRHRLLALQAWWHAVRRVPLEVSEPVVASAKLGWWQTQLRQVPNGPVDHPLLQGLQPALRETPQAVELLLQALHSVQPMAPHAPDDWKQLLRQLHAGAGAVGRAAAALDGLPAPAQDWAAELAVALELLDVLRDVGRDARRDAVRLPRELLAAHGLGPHDLTDLRDSPALRSALRDAAQRAGDLLRQAEAMRPRGLGAAARVGVSLSHMAEALLQDMRDSDYPLLNQRLALPPLRLLWAAWRGQWVR